MLLDFFFKNLSAYVPVGEIVSGLGALVNDGRFIFGEWMIHEAEFDLV